MNYYIANLVCIIIIYFICCACIKDNEKKQRIFLFITFIQLFLFLAMRRIDIGVDLQNYIPFLDRVKEFVFNEIFEIGYEPGYNIYCKIIMTVTQIKQIFMIITAVVTLLGTIYYIYKKS